MALVPNSNLSGLPQITAEDLKGNDPARLNRILRLFATQIQGVQTGKASSTTITNVTQNLSGGGGGGAGGSSSAVSTTPGVTVQGTHIQRLSTFLPVLEDAGTYYYETDRTVTYLNFLPPSNIQVWQYVNGTMQAPIASRPGDLTTNDSGLFFYATDLALTYLWNGSSWVLYNNVEPILQDTHANRLANFPSVNYAISTLFFETDRTAYYIVQNAAGTVNTSGTAVTWATGNHFVNTGTGFTGVQWPAGTVITINGVAYPISVTSSATALTLTTTAGTQTGVAYSVTSGRWVYTTGEDATTQAALPADFGENDTGFLNSVTDYAHVLQWSGSVWTWGPGESGSGYFQDFAVAPTGSGWQACDGSTGVKYLKADGTTATVTVPNTAGSAAYRKSGASYASIITAATVPTLLMASYTPAGTISAPALAMNAYTPAGSISGATFSGSPVGLTSSTFTPVALATTAITSVGGSTTSFTPSGSISGETFSGTPATLTGTVSAPAFTGTPATLTGTITLPADPVAHYQAITFFRQ